MEGPSLAGAPCCWPSPQPPGGPGRRRRPGRSWRALCAAEEAAAASRTSRERRRSAPAPPRSAPRTARARREPAKRTTAAASWCEVRAGSPGPGSPLSASPTGALPGCARPRRPVPLSSTRGRLAAGWGTLPPPRPSPAPLPAHPRPFPGAGRLRAPASGPRHRGGGGGGFPRLRSVRQGQGPLPQPAPPCGSRERSRERSRARRACALRFAAEGPGLGRAYAGRAGVRESSSGATDPPGRLSPAGGTRRQRERGESISFAFKALSQEKSVTERRRVRGYFFFLPLFRIPLSRPGMGGTRRARPGLGSRRDPEPAHPAPPPALSPPPARGSPAPAWVCVANPESLGRLGGDAAGAERSPRLPGRQRGSIPGPRRGMLRVPLLLRRPANRSPEKLRGRSVCRAEAARPLPRP